MATVSFSENNIYHNKKRTAKLGLLSILNRDEFNKLVDKYYRDENGNLHCAYTWEILSQDNLELEHIIPVSLGGGTVIFNCVPSSSKVNGRSEKYNNYLFDWWKNYPDELLEKLINYICILYSNFLFFSIYILYTKPLILIILIVLLIEFYVFKTSLYLLF